MLKLLTIFLVSDVFSLVYSDILKGPTYTCEQIGNKCVFYNVKLSEIDPEWQPIANKPSAVKHIEFHNGNIPIITSDICRSFPNLETFIMSDQNVTEIHENAFQHCTKVRSFIIAGNNIKELPTNLFQYSTKATNIDFFHNRISELNPSIFYNLINLNTIQLASNNLTSFPIELIKNNKNLRELHLDGNDLVDFDVDDMLENCRSIRILDLDQNVIFCARLKEIYDALKGKNIKMGIAQMSKNRDYHVRKFKGMTCISQEEWLVAQIQKSVEKRCLLKTESTTIDAIKELKEEIESIKITQNTVCSEKSDKNIIDAIKELKTEI